MSNHDPSTCPWCYKNLKKTHSIHSLGSRWMTVRDKETNKIFLVQRYPDPHLCYYDRKNLGFYLPYTFHELVAPVPKPLALLFSIDNEHVIIKEYSHGT